MSTHQEDFGPYKLTHLLGKGGMASVFRAVRSGPMGFAKEVAIKRIHDSLIDNEAILKGLINEARIGGQLKHPNIVEIYEFNKVGEAYYLAMEFVDGWTLDKIVKLSREYNMPLPPSVVLEIGADICEGLEYAHTLESLDGQEVKLVHRDLKPANIIISRYGRAKIMDFGIAKAATNLFKTTMADVTKGTPHYMSPEQVAGAKDLSGRSDLFAMGSVLYELCTFRVLFTGDALATVLFNVVKAEVGPQIEEADNRVPGIGPILSRLLKKDPKERPPSAGQVGRSLRRLREESYPDGPTIKQFLYSLKDRMLSGATRVSGASVGTETVADETMAQVEGEPEFATMLAEVPQVDPGKDAALAAARAAADAEIGGNRVFASAGSIDVDTRDETAAALPSGLIQPDPMDVGETRRTVDPKETHPNQRATKKIRRKKTTSPLIYVAAVLGLILLGTLGFIAKEFMGPAEDPTPEPAVVDLSLPDIEFPEDIVVPGVEKPTPRPRRDPTPAASTSTPEPTPAAEPPSDPTPADATPAPPPDITPAPVAAVDPTPAPTPTPTPAPVVAEARPDGTGKLLIKKSTPYYAKVWIDGIDTGKSTPMMGLEIPAGKHTITLVGDDGRKSAPRTISVAKGGTVKLGSYDFDTKQWDE